MKKPFAYLVTLCLFAPCFAGMADIVLLESVQPFELYNQFEQPLSVSEKSAILPFSPFQVIRPDVRLGDQVTRALQCQFRHQTYFLLKDEKGVVIGTNGRMRILKSCALVEDTVEIVKGGVAFTAKSPMPGASRESLPKGARLIILFKYGNAYYSLQTAPAERYGWVQVSAHDAWKHVKITVSRDSAVVDLVFSRIAQRIETANSQYKMFFDRIGAGVGSQKSVPHWSKSNNTAEWTWTLSEPYGHTGELDASTAELLNEVRDLLIGKPFVVSYDKGRITLSPKPAGAP